MLLFFRWLLLFRFQRFIAISISFSHSHARNASHISISTHFVILGCVMRFPSTNGQTLKMMHAMDRSLPLNTNTPNDLHNNRQRKTKATRSYAKLNTHDSDSAITYRANGRKNTPTTTTTTAEKKKNRRFSRLLVCRKWNGTENYLWVIFIPLYLTALNFRTVLLAPCRTLIHIHILLSLYAMRTHNISCVMFLPWDWACNFIVH